MIKRKPKYNSKIYGGPSRKYRSPRVFGARKEQKKKLELPTIPKTFWKFLLYVLIIVFLSYLVFFSNKFVVKDIIVEGNSSVTNERLQSYIPMNSNIFRLDIDLIKKNILHENSEIKTVEVYRGIPDAMKIIVTEYENKLRWQTVDGVYLVSAQGKITKKMGEGESYDYPLIVDTKNIPVNLGDYVVSANFVAFVLNAHEKFFEVTNIKPTNFEVTETTFDINLRTEAGFYVKLNTMRSSTKQLDSLKTVLVSKRAEITEYVDLRIDGWAYYK